MIGELNCTECFMRGNGLRTADFVLNGQSLCQSHTHVAVIDRGQAQLAYTWSDVEDEEPVLKPVESETDNIA